MRLIPIVAAAMIIGVSATVASAQSMDTTMKGNPGHAHGASTAGGKPQPVNPAEVQRMDTTMKGNPGHAHGASATAGKPQPVDPAEVKRMDTSDPSTRGAGK